ncbi:heavy metal-associated isoprenylated plant protein 3-like [Carex rostrata]
MIGCRRAEVVAVLKVDFHNDGCVDEILQSTKCFPGLEEVKIDRKANRVTAVGTMNPWKLRDKIEKETKHKVEVLCSAKDQKAVTQNTLVLKVVLHCDGCIRRIRRTILKIQGVEQVTVDSEKNHITVKGTMNTKGFAEYVSKKIRRQAEVVEPKTEKKCNGQMTQVGRGSCSCNQCGHHIYMVPAPQLLSDENPNACVVM